MWRTAGTRQNLEIVGRSRRVVYGLTCYKWANPVGKTSWPVGPADNERFQGTTIGHHTPRSAKRSTADMRTTRNNPRTSTGVASATEPALASWLRAVASSGARCRHHFAGTSGLQLGSATRYGPGWRFADVRPPGLSQTPVPPCPAPPCRQQRGCTTSIRDSSVWQARG